MVTNKYTQQQYIVLKPRTVSKTMRAVRRVLAVVLPVVLWQATAAQSDQCTTPDNLLGDCKNIRQCPRLLSLLSQKPLTARNADYLRRSQCGFEGNDPKVCCPIGAAAGTTAKPAFTIPTSSSVSQKTSSLLPAKGDCGIVLDDKIYGGNITNLDEFPWMALLEYQLPDGSRGFYCGGVLISKRYVLTAAHCLKGKDLPRSWKLISVRLGEWNTDTDIDCQQLGPLGEECADPAINVPVEDRIAHENYNPQDQNQYHDIALLRLAREVKFTVYVKPICLPSTSVELRNNFIGDSLHVAGWGKTENSSESNIKLKVKVPVVSLEDCNQKYNAVRVKIAESQICAGGVKGKDSCRGDSGGPLMVYSSTKNKEDESYWYTAGIVSFGPTPCGFENWPGIYTKVANYVDWIIGKLKP